MKKLLFSSVFMTVVLVLAFAGGGRQSSGQTAQTAAGYKPINDGKPVKLLIDFHDSTPTLNKVPTPENPTVVLSTQRIADKFMQIHPNVSIEWVRTKPLENPTLASEWYVTQFAAGTAPAVSYTWNATWPERDWYFDLTPAMDTPNEYLPGNTRWKDQFPEYIWSKSMSNANGRIIGVPYKLNPGPAIALYYNKDIFAKLNLKIPANWEELRNVAKALKDAGYGPVAPWEGSKAITTDIWPIYDSIGPSYAGALMDKTDYNHDGMVELSEQARAVKDNVYNPVQQEYAREVLLLLKDMYNNMYVPGFDSVDLDALWDTGTVGLKHGFAGNVANETSDTMRKFQVGIFPFVTVTTATSKFVKNIEYTKSGPYQPNGHGFNIMKPVVEKDKGVEEAAIAWMKFFTVPENLNDFILENGAYLGSVRDSVIPPLLEEWLGNSFPIFPNVPYGTSWPTGFTSDGYLSMGKELEMWVKGQTNDTTFFRRWNELQQKSADDLIVATNINTAGW